MPVALVPTPAQVIEQPVAPVSLWRRVVSAVLHSVGLLTAQEQAALRARSLAEQEERQREHVAAMARAEESAKAVEEMCNKLVERQAERAEKVKADSAKQRANLDANLKGIAKIIASHRAVPKAQPMPALLPEATRPAVKPVPPQLPLKKPPAKISDTQVDSTIARLKAIEDKEKSPRRGRRP